MTAAEAASLIKNGDVVGMSGFTPAGAPKEVTLALAAIAEKEHAEGREFKMARTGVPLTVRITRLK